jgi:hypothetical protein
MGVGTGLGVATGVALVPVLAAGTLPFGAANLGAREGVGVGLATGLTALTVFGVAVG